MDARLEQNGLDLVLIRPEFGFVEQLVTLDSRDCDSSGKRSPAESNGIAVSWTQWLTITLRRPTYKSHQLSRP
jgi:hypothetical protein